MAKQPKFPPDIQRILDQIEDLRAEVRCIAIQRNVQDQFLGGKVETISVIEGGQTILRWVSGKYADKIEQHRDNARHIARVCYDSLKAIKKTRKISTLNLDALLEENPWLEEE